MALLKLLGLCAAMFAGAYLCGLIPLKFTMSPRRMKYFTTVGVGLLIGVSFIVIIPEGVHTYYGAKEPPPPAHTTNLAAAMNLTLTHPRHVHDHSNENMKVGHQNAHLASDHEEEEHQADTKAHEEHSHQGHDHETTDHGHEGHSHKECVDLGRSSTSVGLALIAGFVVMLLVDRLGGAEEGHAHAHGGDTPVAIRGDTHSHGDQHAQGHTHAHAPQNSSGNHEARRSDSPPPVSPSSGGSSTSGTLSTSASSSSLDDQKQSLRINPQTPRLIDVQVPPLPPVVQQQFDQTATVGILVHSAIDGLALGAISVSDNSSLELVVFFAIILHKAPAAFGLTSFLLHQGRSQAEVRKHLLAFSLAAPLTSLATYVAFGYYNALAGSNSLSASSPDGQALLGLCLLFSAGTFLFTIAVHILPEIQSSTTQQHAELPFVACLIGGILGPLLFSGHNHGH